MNTPGIPTLYNFINPALLYDIIVYYILTKCNGYTAERILIDTSIDTIQSPETYGQRMFLFFRITNLYERTITNASYKPDKLF